MGLYLLGSTNGNEKLMNEMGGRGQERCCQQHQVDFYIDYNDKCEGEEQQQQQQSQNQHMEENENENKKYHCICGKGFDTSQSKAGHCHFCFIHTMERKKEMYTVN